MGTESSPVTAGEPLAFAPRDWDTAGILEWRQPRLLERRWELWADGEPLARLRHRGVFKRGFLAESARGRWELSEGWSGNVSIRREGEPEPVAHYRRGWFFSGRVTLADGQELPLVHRGWWLGEFALTNRERFEFFRIRRRFSPPRIQASVELTDSGRRLEVLEPLLLLSWAALLESHHRAAAH